MCSPCGTDAVVGARHRLRLSALTQGYLLGEVVRRVSGVSLGTFFRNEVAEPLGVDFHIGLPASEDHRVADLMPPTHGRSMPSGANDIATRTWLSCPLDATEPATRGVERRSPRQAAPATHVRWRRPSPCSRAVAS